MTTRGRRLRRLRLRAVWLLILPFFWLAAPTPTLLGVGGVVALLGLWLRGWAAGTIHKDEQLTVTGPYAHTRNPLYVGSLLIGVGVAVAGGHWAWPVAFAVFYLLAYSLTIAHEAEHLGKRYGERYVEYASEVPAFVPRPTPYRPSATVGSGAGFRWSQYRHNREYEALLGASVAFAVLASKVLELY